MSKPRGSPALLPTELLPREAGPAQPCRGGQASLWHPRGWGWGNWPGLHTLSDLWSGLVWLRLAWPSHTILSGLAWPGLAFTQKAARADRPPPAPSRSLPLPECGAGRPPHMPLGRCRGHPPPGPLPLHGPCSRMQNEPPTCPYATPAAVLNEFDGETFYTAEGEAVPGATLIPSTVQNGLTGETLGCGVGSGFVGGGWGVGSGIRVHGVGVGGGGCTLALHWVWGLGGGGALCLPVSLAAGLQCGQRRLPGGTPGCSGCAVLWCRASVTRRGCCSVAACCCCCCCCCTITLPVRPLPLDHSVVPGSLAQAGGHGAAVVPHLPRCCCCLAALLPLQWARTWRWWRAWRWGRGCWPGWRCCWWSASRSSNPPCS